MEQFLFVYLTYHFTNVGTKLYMFCIFSVQSEHTKININFYKALF